MDNSNARTFGDGINKTNRESSKLITLTAFLIGYFLIDNLNSNEQSALGNFFMLIGQTLCTSGSDNFRKDWSPYANPTNYTSDRENTKSDEFSFFDNNSDKSYMSREEAVEMLKKARDIFDREINKLK